MALFASHGQIRYRVDPRRGRARSAPPNNFSDDSSSASVSASEIGVYFENRDFMKGDAIGTAKYRGR